MRYSTTHSPKKSTKPPCFRQNRKIFNKALAIAKNLVDGRYHHKLYDGLASCLTNLSEFDQAIEIYKHIFQREEGKKKWDAQRSIKFVNKLKRKKAIGMLPDVIPAEENPSSSDTSSDEA